MNRDKKNRGDRAPVDAQLARLWVAAHRPLKMLVKPSTDHCVSSTLARRGVWEPYNTRLLQSLLDEGDHMLDLGANLGYFSLIAADRVGPEGRVWAFEPEPENHRFCELNLQLNGFRQVVSLRRMAIGDATDRQFLFRGHHNHGAHQLEIPLADGHDPLGLRVDVRSLEDLSREDPELQRIDLAKLDVQGYETRALLGMRRLIERNRDRLIVLTEFSPALLRPFDGQGLGLGSFLSFLEEDCYTVLVVDRSRPEIRGAVALATVEPAALRRRAEQMTTAEDLDLVLVFSARGLARLEARALENEIEPRTGRTKRSRAGSRRKRREIEAPSGAGEGDACQILLRAPSFPRILILGDAVAPTGFSRVIQGSLTPLADRYEFHQLGINYKGDPHDWPWDVYPAGAQGDPCGLNRVASLVSSLEPDLIFMNNDLELSVQYLAILQAFERPKTVAYCPVNAGPIDPESIRGVLGLDFLVTYTSFGRREIERALARLGGQNNLPRVEVMPHGVDVRTFYPLQEDRAAAMLQARRDLFPGLPGMDDAFIVLNANRNIFRKRIDVTIMGFALFSAGKPPGVKLHLHMEHDSPLGWNIERLARRYGIHDRLILTGSRSGRPALADEALNRVYNAADVGLNTASDEGWGLVPFEHAATGAPQIVPAHTGSLELWQGSAELLEPRLRLVNPHLMTEAHVIDPAAVAAALERLYSEPDLRRRRGEQAFANATRSAYLWPQIAEGWHLRFQELLSSGLETP